MEDRKTVYWSQNSRVSARRTHWRRSTNAGRLFLQSKYSTSRLRTFVYCVARAWNSISIESLVLLDNNFKNDNRAKFIFQKCLWKVSYTSLSEFRNLTSKNCVECGVVESEMFLFSFSFWSWNGVWKFYLISIFLINFVFPLKLNGVHDNSCAYLAHDSDKVLEPFHYFICN